LEKWRNFIDQFVGNQLDVLIENRRDRKTGNLTGLSDNYIRVLVEGEDDLKNHIMRITISRRQENVLLGELIS
jgi:threonylcarbamoyladenosine tRNA methylthiotransferase MtaB